MAFSSTLAKGIAKSILRFGLAAVVIVPQAVFARDFAKPQAGVSNERPKEYEGIGIEEKLGGEVPLDLQFKDEEGRLVSLRSFASSGKPILLSLAYYSCPNLCTLHLNGLGGALKTLKEPVGKEFNFVVVSIDPRETPALAHAKKENYLRAYGHGKDVADGWHFLVGDEASVRQLADAVGFKYRWDEDEKQYAHASAAFVVTPEGRISRYFQGIEFDPRALRLSLIEASSGKIGTLVDKVILFCFHFDPKASKYTLYASNLMRAAGALAAAAMAAFLVSFWWRSKRSAASAN
jgi:protein SCO1/2